jgi:hypothetical protein
MIAHRFNIDRKSLDGAPDQDRTFFLMLGHFANQSAILGKWAGLGWPSQTEIGFRAKRRCRAIHTHNLSIGSETE